MREDSPELYINRRLRRRPMLDQIRPHGLVTMLAFTSVYFLESGLFNGLGAQKLKKFPLSI